MKIAFGYLFIALSVVVILALISFTPYDSLLFVSRVNVPPENIAGSFGAFISSYIVLLYGRWAGYIIGFSIFVVGVNILTKTKIGRIFIKFLLFIVCTISLSIILGLSLKSPTYIEAGLIGVIIGETLALIIPRFILIPLFSVALFLALSGSMKLFQKFTVFIAKGVGAVLLFPFRALGLLINRDNKDDTENTTPSYFENNSLEDAYDNNSVFIDKKSVPSNIKADESDTNIVNEPEYLRKFHQVSKSDVPLSSSIYESTPGFLSDKKEKGAIISYIDSAYDSVIFDEETEKDGDAPSDNSQYVGLNGSHIPVDEAYDNLDSAIAERNNADKKEASDNKKELEEKTKVADNTPDKKDTDYRFPKSAELERSFNNFTPQEEENELKRVSAIIESTFESFKIEIKVSGYSRGPAITRYEIVPPEGLKLKSITNLEDDLALKLGTRNIRIVAPIGGKSLIGVEVPNKHRRNVMLREIIESKEFINSDAELPLILGEDLTGNILIDDLSSMPHLLIGGTTGSGKSVYVNSLICGMLFKHRQDELKFIMIDPKMVELELYNGIPHLLAPIITQPEDALAALEWSVAEMDSRYKTLSEFSVRSIKDYNEEIRKINTVREKQGEQLLEELPYIVIIIDEFANLMLRSPKETEKAISRIAAMARAVGIHLVIATQRPSVDVVTGIIKANFPSRISFRVNSKTDSRTILDENGAESLLNKGDMLLRTPNSSEMYRIQSPYVPNSDVEAIVSELKKNGTPDYTIDFEQFIAASQTSSDSDYTVDYSKDALWEDVLRVAVEKGEVSASFLQRKFSIGYNRASRIIEAMEQANILGPFRGSSKPREVLIKQEDIVNYI